MADISAYIRQIRNAKRGETVRDSITEAIKTLDLDGVEAETLSGRPPSHFALYKDVNNAFLTGTFANKSVFETKVVKGSNKAVQSGALYDLFKKWSYELNRVLGEDISNG